MNHSQYRYECKSAVQGWSLSQLRKSDRTVQGLGTEWSDGGSDGDADVSKLSVVAY